MKSVYCAVRTGSLNKAVCASSLKGLIPQYVAFVLSLITSAQWQQMCTFRDSSCAQAYHMRGTFCRTLNFCEYLALSFFLSHHETDVPYSLHLPTTLCTLDQVHLTRRTRATFFPQHGVMLPAETFETRKRLLTLTLTKPR